MAPQNDMLESSSPVPQNVTSLGDTVFTKVTKFNEVLRVGPNQYNNVLVRRGNLDTQTHAGGEHSMGMNTETG